MGRIRSAFSVITLLTVVATSAVAGPLFSCPKAVSSDDDSFIVISEVQLENLPNNRVKVEWSKAQDAMQR
jgi:hypothetical protein